MTDKIAWVCPMKNDISNFQNHLLADKMKELGWDIQFNQTDNTTKYIFCTSVSQYKRADELSRQHNNLPIITWVMDITPDPSIMEDFIGYAQHIIKAWRVIALNESVQWDTLKWTGRYRVDVMYPCVDDKLIESSEAYDKENLIVVIGALNVVKEPQIALYAWDLVKLIPKPRLAFIYMGEGLYEYQLKVEAQKMKGEVFFFKNADDRLKWELLKKAKLLIMPCKYGGFNIPPIEAWFCKTPALISSDHNYHTFKDSCFRFKTGDIEDCKKMIEWAYDNYDLLDDPFNNDVMNQFRLEECANRLDHYFLANKLVKGEK